MQIGIYGQHIEVTDALRSYTEEKFQRLARHFERPIEARVQLSIDKPHHKVVGHITMPGAELHADASGETMYAAIDVLVDKLDRLLMKHKEKKEDGARRAESATRGFVAG